MTIIELVAKHGIIREGANGPHVKTIQEALRKSGAELVIDGDFGTITRVAVERFQATVRIAADGMVGPITATYLDNIKPLISNTKPLPSVLKIAPWLSYMRSLSGTKEIPGTRSNPLILSWIRTLGARYPLLRPNITWYTNDDIPWCGLGEAEAVGNCDPGYMPPIAPLRALNWGDWGQDVGRPIQGAVAVKTRKGGGHVTTVESVSRDGKTVFCRGANQSNMINVAEYKVSEFHEYRWPTGAALPPMKLTIGSFADAVRVTEA